MASVLYLNLSAAWLVLRTLNSQQRPERQTPLARGHFLFQADLHAFEKPCAHTQLVLY